MTKGTFPFSKSNFLNSARLIVADFESVEKELLCIWNYFERKANSVASLRNSGRRTRAKKREYKLMSSSAAKIVCYIDALHQLRNKYSQKVVFADIQRKSQRVNPRSALVEPVRAFWLKKPSGGQRPIASLGALRRANINIALAMAHLQALPSHFEFAAKGRGRDAAAKTLINQINKGENYVGIADLQDAYGSITREAVLNLKLLPASVVLNTIFIPSCSPIITHNDNDLSSALRRGLMQGSRTSPFIQQKLIERVLLQLDAKFACSYGDDIALLAASREEAASKVDALESAFASQPGGALKLKTKDVLKVGEHMNYCGYWFRRRKPEYGNNARVTPSNESIRRFYCRLAFKLFWGEGRAEDTVMNSYATRWADSFRCWTGKPNGKEIAMAVYQHNIWPKVRLAIEELRAEARSFASFRDMQDYIQAMIFSSVPNKVIIPNWPPKF